VEDRLDICASKHNNGDSVKVTFSGRVDEDAEVFIDDFNTVCTLKEYSEEQAIMWLRLSLLVKLKVSKLTNSIMRAWGSLTDCRC
jgi:hypothetical protein